MQGLYKRLFQKAKNNLNDVKFEGIFISVALAFLVLVIGGNIIRVFTNGQSNYATFLEEKNELTKLQNRNQTLTQEFDYVNSDEYKALLLRDAQNLAKSEETLFNTKEKPSFFVETPEYLDLEGKTDYSDWWVKLIGM
jgi:cell division protein FtsB